MPPVTIMDIAKATGRSYPTVSRALNDHPKVSAKTKAAIRAAADRLGYSPNLMAKGLVQQRSQTLGLIATELNNPVRSALIEALRDLAVDRGYQLLVNGYRDESELPDRVRAMASRRVDGLIVGNLGGDMLAKPCWPQLKAASESGVAVVVFSHASGGQVDHVAINYESMVRQLTEHLIDVHGHRRICFAGAPPDSPRARGYGAAMQAAGLAAEMQFFCQGDYHMQAARSSVEGILKQSPRFTAIVCHNDLTAIGIMAGLREHGRRVPEDVAVVGLDDVELASYYQPTLTTAGVTPRRIADVFIELLSDRIKETEPTAPRRLELDFTLQFRESCGCSRNPTYKEG